MYKVLIQFVFALTVINSFASTDTDKEVEKEAFIAQAQAQIFRGSRLSSCLSQFETLNCQEQEDLVLDAIEDLIDNNWHDLGGQALVKFIENKLSLVNLIRSKKLLAAESGELNRLSTNLKLRIQTYLSDDRILNQKENLYLCQYFEKSYCTNVKVMNNPIRLPSAEVIRDLYYEPVDLSHYSNGRYQNTPRMFMFCREDRQYPCLILGRDQFNRPILNKNGELWQHPVLGYSRHKKKYNEFNGNTPAGIFLVKGVMPKANKQIVFGKFRRIILDFIPMTIEEQDQKIFLPTSSHRENWWHEGLIARDLGRGLFRMHGTGFINFDRSSPYYTFYGTSGCVASRENTYDNIEYRDQRLLLDQWMEAQDLNAVYENESQIKGVLYVINIDNEKSAVTLTSLKNIGIF